MFLHIFRGIFFFVKFTSSHLLTLAQMLGRAVEMMKGLASSIVLSLVSKPLMVSCFWRSLTAAYDITPREPNWKIINKSPCQCQLFQNIAYIQFQTNVNTTQKVNGWTNLWHKFLTSDIKFWRGALNLTSMSFLEWALRVTQVYMVYDHMAN